MGVARNLRPLFVLPSKRKIVSYVEKCYLPVHPDIGDDIECDEGEEHDVEEFDDVEESDLDADDNPLGTWIEAVTDYLTNEGVHGASSYPWSRGTWYEAGDESWNMDGEMERFSYHLKGFAEEEEKEIYETLKRGRHI